MPDCRVTSEKVPLPLFLNSCTNPGGSPRGPQFTAIPFQVQSGFSPGRGSFSSVVLR